jgi:uncharacterized iron-regulated membrane protein
MRRALVTLHRWFGLFSAVFLFIAGLTGALIAWDHELDAWLNPALFRSESRGTPLPALALAERLEHADPRLIVSYLELGHQRGHTQLLSVNPRIDAATGKPFELDFNQVALDPSSGAVRAKRFWGAASLSRENLLPFLYKLHFSLHIPEASGMELGTLFMGVVGCVWFLDAFIALWISFPQIGSWRKSLAFRFRAGGYRLIFDLHRSGGVWLWLLLLALSFTSIAMNLGDQVVRPLVSLFSELKPDPFEGRQAAAGPTPVPKLTRAQIVERARAEAVRQHIEAPLGAIYYAQEVGAYGVGFFTPGNGHGDLSLGNPWLHFDGQDGRLLGANIPGAGSAGDLFLQLQFPLHSGRIGGVTGRIVVTLLGLAVATLSVTGVLIWARKRRARASSAHKRSAKLLDS